MSVSLVLVPLAIAIGGALSDLPENEIIKYEDVNNIVQNNRCYQVETPIKRMDLLVRCISELGYDLQKINDKYIMKYTDGDIEFIRNSNSQIDILFSSGYSQDQVQNISSDIYNQYTSVLQAEIYNTLKQKAEERGYTLENEVIEDDNSIVLNFIV
ncbi:hypothetical protein EAI30_02200 [Romboutsia ilealis]|uniref:Uncharacterized protein n=1 Tax=Romboutsia faecis TaxID=2764597 RepID=A0ABR7JQE2_9FIRM|nr:hypothetical protein [Romboutsia faecis]MBC5997138.1 hypothetical protein [Romboutsia faecis]MRN23419.1 hypothetical protein [Romboutsia ilealis]